jgi:outer membrane protein assembly factor BamD (BamD/ComL family)
MIQGLKPIKYFNFFLMTLVFLSVSTKSYAAWTLKNGRLVDSEEVATLSSSQHYDVAMQALQAKDWKTAAINFKIVAKCFPLSTCAEDANYYLGIALFKLEEFEFSNDAFSAYIGAKTHPKFFIEAIEYKFCIAEAFKKGATRRIFSTKKMPKWASGQNLGLTIYDEVIAALPSHEFAAKSLYSKGCLLFQMKHYRDSVDALQLIVKRFLKHELAPESYLLITNIYLHQSKCEFQNPDILAFAEINLRRFKADFPRDERVSVAENAVLEIKEAYAKGLYETGQFYERIEEPRASIIYYQNAINQFPETSVAKLCEDRLCSLRSRK